MPPFPFYHPFYENKKQNTFVTLNRSTRLPQTLFFSVSEAVSFFFFLHKV